MPNDLEILKHRLPLLDYLQRQRWTGRPVGSGSEYVGLCPLHEESHPSFYVNPGKNLFYCHGCGCGGDLIRFVQLSLNLSFRESVVHLEKEIRPLNSSSVDGVLADTLSFYQEQLQGNPDAWKYLQERGLRDRKLMAQLGAGYAPGGSLRRHLAACGRSLPVSSMVRALTPSGAESSSPAATRAVWSTSMAAAWAVPQPTGFCHVPKEVYSPGKQSAPSLR